MSGRFVTYAENMCALIWLSVVSDLGTFQQFRNLQAPGRPHLESLGEARSKILSKDKRHEGIVERGATPAWVPESWDYHALPTVVRKRAHTGGHSAHSTASRRHCVRKIRTSEEEVRASGEKLGEFPGHSWRGITMASPKPLDFLHALICTLLFHAREVAIIRILVI